MLTVLENSAPGDSTPVTPGTTSQLSLNFTSPPTCILGSKMYPLPPAGQHLLLLVFHNSTEMISSGPVGSWTLSLGSSGAPQPLCEKVQASNPGICHCELCMFLSCPSGFLPTCWDLWLVWSTEMWPCGRSQADPSRFLGPGQ